MKSRCLTTQGHVSNDLIQASAVNLNEAVVDENKLCICSHSTTNLGAFVHKSLNQLHH